MLEWRSRLKSHEGPRDNGRWKGCRGGEVKISEISKTNLASSTILHREDSRVMILKGPIVGRETLVIMKVHPVVGKGNPSGLSEGLPGLSSVPTVYGIDSPEMQNWVLGLDIGTLVIGKEYPPLN